MIGNKMAAPEQLLGSVIAHRRLLGICHAGPLQSEGSPGDWVCFFVPGKGIVGHAQLASMVEDSRKSGIAFGFLSVGDAGVPVLPGFAHPPAFTF